MDRHVYSSLGISMVVSRLVDSIDWSAAQDKYGIFCPLVSRRIPILERLLRGDVENAPDYCAIEAAMEIVGGKWKMAILNHLFAGPRRFGELRRAMPTITQRMLTRQLRELESDGLVQRTEYPQVPPKVEYALTDVGSSLRPIADQLESWGHWYRAERNSGQILR